MRAQGTDIWDFIRLGWPQGYVLADYRIEPVYLATGECLLNLDHKYDLADFGILVDSSDLTYFMSFELAYMFWHRRQHAVCVVTVPMSDLEEARQVFADRGWGMAFEYLPDRERKD